MREKEEHNPAFQSELTVTTGYSGRYHEKEEGATEIIVVGALQ